jgi:hypothetical protein
MRLIDIDAVRNAIEEEWDGACSEYPAQEIIDDTIHAVEQVDPVDAIPLDWIRAYIDHLKAMGVQLALKNAQAVSVMVDKWAMEQNGNATCGPDYCEIGGTHND